MAGTGILNPLVGLGYNYTPSGLNIQMPSGNYLPTGISRYFNVSGGIPALAVGVGTGIIFNMTGIYDDTLSITVRVSGCQECYYGVTGIPASYNATFISGLPLKSLQPSHNVTVSGTLSSSNYLWYCHRQALSDPSFTDCSNNLKGGFTKVASGVSFTNAAGFNENYYIWRTDNPGLGAVQFTVGV